MAWLAGRRTPYDIGLVYSGPGVTGAQDAPEILERFNATLDLVDMIARQVRRTLGRGVELGDLVGYGCAGLMDAAQRFDPARGVPFRAYASYRVRGAIIDGVRTMSRLPRRTHERLTALAAAGEYGRGAAEDAFVPQPPGAQPKDAERALDEHMAGMATAIALGLVAAPGRGEEGEHIGVAAGADPEAAVADAELLDVVRRAIGDLPSEEAELVRRHYLEGERFDQVAAKLGMSKSWASRLHTRAIGRLTKRLRHAAS
jgi:RNA polymerase sigma factor FliA